MISTIHQRGLVASIALATCFTGLSCRLIYVQVTHHDYYLGKAAKQNVHNEPIYARRGEILDVLGSPLAQNEPVKTIVADGSLIKDHDGLANLLAKPLDMDAGRNREGTQVVWIRGDERGRLEPGQREKAREVGVKDLNLVSLDRSDVANGLVGEAR